MGCSKDIEDQESIAILITLCISIVCSFILIVFCTLSEILEQFTRRILFYLSLNTMYRASFRLIFRIKIMWNACFILSYINDVCLVSSVVWAASIPITLYMVIVKKQKNFEKYHKRWLICAYIIVALVLALPFITNSYARIGNLCILEASERGTIWALALVYLPSWIMIFIVAIFYMKIYIFIKNTSDIKFRSILFERGMIYSVLIAFALLPMTIVRTLYLFYSNCMMSYFYSIAYSISHLLGFYNLVALFINQNIIKAIKNKLIKYEKKRTESHTGASFLISLRDNL